VTAAPSVLPFQPAPLLTRVSRRRNGGGWMSAINRHFGRIDPRRCRLCPRSLCSYDPDDGSCLVMVDGFVTDAAAPLYNVAGLGG
jgi:hypothetical protein